jgi:hypothetical protein
LGLSLLGILLGGCAASPADPAGGLRAAVFVSDATPPAGHPLCGGWTEAAKVVEAPLRLKGVLLDLAGERCVVAALDWCVLRGEAYDALREAVALGAGAKADRVAIQTTHTHSAPIADLAAERLMRATSKPLPHLDPAWFGRVAQEARRAVVGAVARLEPVTHAGTGKGIVERFASNRRVPGPDGRIRVRYSATKDPFLREAPEGRIDPFLRTVSLYSGDRVLVRLHYYASHPQSRYGDGRISPDTPGDAREAVEAAEGVPQIWFAGCGGDVTAGKYNDGSPGSRVELARQLRLGMERAIADTRRVPVESAEWRTLEVRLPGRTEPERSEAGLRALMADVGASASDRLTAALGVAWYERLRVRDAIDVSRLRIGPADLVHLPGEPFVEYQLHAQAARPDRFVAVAGYGEGGPGYLCTDAAIEEGGYEPTQSLMGRPGERVLKEAVEALLR